jgi:ankyrin repeat protein
MKLLAEAGINLLEVDNFGNNALHMAVWNNHINIVQLLIDSNFPVDMTNNLGLTPFHSAVI